MRFAIVTDIHANREALEAVLASLERLRIDRYICLGDVVGYGADPKWCLQTIRDTCELTIMGNHDAAISGKMDFSYYYDAARQVLEWTRQQLDPDELEWLANLPYSQVDEDTGQCFTHGDPIMPENYNYIYTLQHAQDLLHFHEELKYLTWVGHSHLRRIFRFESEEMVREVVPENIVLDPQYKYLIAAGGVGQPRDNDPRTGFVVYDSDTQKATFHRLEYDIAKAAQKIIDAGLPHGFAYRLYNGV